MDLNRIIHPLVSIDDTDTLKYDKYGRISMNKTDKGIWNLKIYKDLKNKTPDGDPTNLDNLPTFCKGDTVKASCTSLYGVDLDGDYYFDSYDSWDNTCFISKRLDGAICFWVLLTDITVVSRNKAITILMKEKEKKSKK